MRVTDQDRVDVGDLLGQLGGCVLDERIASPHDDEPSAPEWADTMTTSAPAFFTCGTTIFACSTMPLNFTLPSTFALSQMDTPGVTRPMMPTLIGFCPFSFTDLTM